MATDICMRRLTKELRALAKDPIKSPKITVAPNEANILEMHYVIEGSENTPYAGGVYHGKLIFPKDYPLKPPSVMMLTPNGRFQPNRRLCLSMSDFHPEVRFPGALRLSYGCLVVFVVVTHSRFVIVHFHARSSFSRRCKPRVGIPCGVLAQF